MHYLVDGYNFFFQIEKEILPLEEKRENFLSFLEEALSTTSFRLTIVFDSHHEQSHTFPSKRLLDRMEVIFSPKHFSADAYLIEQLQWRMKETILVTSDRALKLEAQRMGAKTQSVEQFIHSFIKKKQRRKREEEKPNRPFDFDRYLKAFERRLEEEE